MRWHFDFVEFAVLELLKTLLVKWNLGLEERFWIDRLSLFHFLSLSLFSLSIKEPKAAIPAQSIYMPTLPVIPASPLAA